MKKMLRKVILYFFSLISIVILSNCQIGLGEAVDVQPPTIFLTSPQADALVRDTFVIEGTYSDDLSVGEISITLKEVYTNVEYKQINAVIKPDSDGTKGTWTCSINPKELGIIDGTYVATVSAMDTYLHTGKATQTFSIDNTAPLIVLTSPSSKTIDNPTSYGQVFSVEGKAADDSDVDSIDAIIYDSETNEEIARKTITNVSTQIQIDVATWGGVEDGFYEKIYGNNQEAGTKNYKLGLIAYDGARKVPAEENDRGNATSVFYMNNDFAEISGFKTSIAYNILNGTAKVAAGLGNHYETWEKALEDKKIEQATFSLNPVNNPYFDIQNYEPLGTQTPDGSNSIDLDVETYSFMNKNKLTVNLYVGRDKKAIKTETIGIYLLPCDRYGNLLENEPKVTLLKPYKDKNGNIIGVDNTSQITTVGSTSYRWSSDSINAKDIDGLNIGKYYLFDVVAYDYNGVGIRNDSKYGIKMTSTSAAPIIQITEPGVTKSVASSKPFVVKGLVKTSAEITGLKIFKNIQDNLIEGLDFQTMEEGKTNAEALAITEGIVLNTEESTDVLKIYNYAFTVPSIEDESYTVIIYASDTNGQSGSREITVSNDKEAPKFDSVASITPYVDVEEGEGQNKKILQKVNGLVNIKQLISDNVKVEKVWYSTNETYPTEETHWTEYTDEIKTTLTLNIDTKDFDNDEGVGERIIYLKAQDTAGNVTENGKTEADALIKLIIDQKTDAPRISLSNVTLDGTVCPEVGFTDDQLKDAKQKVSIFGTKANNYILGTVEDDDGIDTVSVWYCTGSKWDEKSEKPLLEAKVEGKTTYNIKAKLPEAEGAYLIKVVVKDIAQQTDFASTTIEPFLVAVDNGAPVLEVKTESGVFKSGNFAVTGTIDDPTAVLKRYTTEDCEGEGTVIATSGGSWTDTINAAGNIYKFWYKATDEYSQTTTKTFDFKYDPSAPKFNITEIQAEDVSEKFGYATESNQYAGYDAETKYGNLTDYFTVKGSVKEGDSDSEANVSGLGSYFYYYVGSTLPTKTNGHYTPVDSTGKLNAGWNTSTITKQEGKDPAWEAPIKFTNFKNGSSVYICFAAIDNAGNLSLINDNPSTVLTVTIDTESPIYKGNPVLTQGETTTIKVLAKDNVSGLNVDSTTVQRNGEQITLKTALPVQGTESEYTSLAYTIAAEDLIVGENKFTIKIKDKAGYTTTSSEVKINNVAPVFSENSEGFPTDGVYQSKDSSGNIFSYIKNIDTGLVSSAKVVCAGNNNKIKSVSYIDTIDGTAGSKVDLTLDDNNYFTITTDLSSYENKIVSRTIVAENIYGQKSEWKYSFNVDNNAPELKLADSKIDEHAMSSDFAEIWFKETMLAINGAFVENGSGISKILYKINDGEEETIISLKQNNEETFKTTISGLTSDATNILKIWAVDNVGNKSEEKEFKINVDTSAPKVEKPTATTTQVSTLSDDDVIIQVKASDVLSGIDSVLISCSGINTDDISSENKDGEYSFTIPYDRFETRNYSFSIAVKDKVGNVAPQQTIEIKSDKKIPEVDITTLTPTVLNSEGKETVNGKIKVSGTVKDETELKELQLTIEGLENPRVQSDLKTTYKNFEFEIDTKDLGNTLKLSFIAIDSFGNKSEEKTKEIIIDQTLDAPKISLSNVTTEGDKWEKVQCPEGGFTEEGLINAKQNASVFGTTSNNYILGTVEDDDGIDKVSVLYCTGSKWDENSKKSLLEATVEGKTTYNIKAKLPETEGAELIKIVVKDSKGETNYSTTTIDPFLIGIDNGAPNLEVKTESGVFYSGTVTVTGTMDDAAAELYRSDKSEKITVDKDGIWTDTINISPDQTTFDYTYTATDEYNQSTTRNFSFKYDPTAPRFNITEIQGSSYDKFDFASEDKVLKYGNLTDYFTVKGTVKDDGSTEANTSGIGSYFYYYVGVGELSNASDTYNPVGDDRKTPINGWKSCTVTKRENENPSWEAPISFKDFANGDSVNIYFAAVDNAGNVSIIKDNPSAVLTVKIDIDKPVVKDPELNLDELTTIKVLALDNESDIDTEAITSTRNGDKIELEVSLLDDETISEGEETQKTYKSFLFKITEKDLVVGDNKFIFSVKDKAGNAKTTEITINNKAPEFSNENTGISESAYRVKDCSYVTAPFTTTANVVCTGNNKLSRVYYSDTYETTDSNDKKVVNTIIEKDIPVSVSDGKFTIPAPEESEDIADYKQKYENKTVTRTVTAENIYGQKATWAYKFNADLTAPIVKNEIKIDGKEAVNDWFNKTTLPISGAYTENGSGVKQVTYKLTNGLNTVVESAGSIYTTKTGSDENFAANIGGFTEGKFPNNLVLYATDNAGNKSVEKSFMNVKIDTTAPVLSEKNAPDGGENETSQIWYRFNGETEWKKLENAILTNKTKDIELTGTFEDKNDKNDKILQSGVREIKINVNGSANPIFAKVYTKAADQWTVPNEGTGFEPNSNNDSPKQGRWFATVSKNVLGESGDYSATISIKDNAGNEGGSGKISFRVDTTPPTVTIEMPSVGAKLNGLNTFSGKVNDANDVQSIKLYYAFGGDSAPTTFGEYTEFAKDVKAVEKELLEKVVDGTTVSLSDVTSWKFTKVDINKILGTDQVSGNLYILPIAYDKAGNNNISETAELKDNSPVSDADVTAAEIDLHSDRPIIKFTNLSWDYSANSYSKYINATTLNASIEDDDGISEVRVAIDNTKPTDLATNDDYKQPLTSGSVKIPLDIDGPKTIWLYVKDSAGGEFETSSSRITTEYASTPYLLYDGKIDNVPNIKAISITKDTTPPTIGTLAYGFASDGGTARDRAENGTIGTKADPVNSIEEVPATKSNFENTNLAGGENRKWIVFEVPVSESGSGVKTVTVKDGTTLITCKNDGTSTSYYSDPIDVSSWSVGDHLLTFTVTDNAGLEVVQTKQIVIDNTAPVAEMITPDSSEINTGVIKFKGTTSDSYSEVVKTQYIVLNNDYYNADKTNKEENDRNSLIDEAIKSTEYSLVGTETSWEFKLDGKPDVEGNKNAKLPANKTDLGNYSYVPQTNEIYTMTVCFYTEDKLGNKGYNYKDFTYNPYGDRPTAGISYPEGKAWGDSKEYVEDYPNLCDMIRIQGSAEDNISMANGKVWIQIDMNNDGVFNENDKAALVETGKYNIVSGTSEIEGKTDDSALDGETFWGIEVSGDSNWSINVNVSNELQWAGNDSSSGTFLGNNKYKVGIRALAMDATGVMGKWSSGSYFLIDVNAPVIETAYFNGKVYKEDMYLSGTQTLTVPISDLAGIKKVSYYWADSINELSEAGVHSDEVEATTSEGDVTTASLVWENPSAAPGERKEYSLKIPISSLEGVGNKLALKVVAYKDSLTNTTENAKYVVNFDNTPPTLPDPEKNEDNGKIVFNSRPYKDVGSKIVNSNGSFTLGINVTDVGGSTFDKLAFYYYRKSETSNSRIYDPMCEGESAKIPHNGDLKSRTIDDNLIYGEEKISIDINNNDETLATFDYNDANYSHIRKGGLVEIDDTWFTIKDITNGKITLDSAIAVPGEKTVFFAYAQVIDYTGAEKNTGATEVSGDGDKMPEFIEKISTTSWNCEAYINSKNIPDGPVNLVVFAFDKAGNTDSQEYKVSVENNAPRLTRVMLATDLNGNESYDLEGAYTSILNDLSKEKTPNGTEFGEYVYYSTLNSEGKASNEVEVNVPLGSEFVVKNNLLVVPEFVGGNLNPDDTGLYYQYKFKNDTDYTTLTILEKSNLFSESKKIVKDDDGEALDGASYEFEIEKDVLEDYESWKGDNRDKEYLEVKFWDSTEETIPGKNSCYALLKMPIIINVTDDIKPTANIIPFYWNSKEDSSFVYDDDGNPLGHIDIPAENSKENPGVSGEVYIEGYAWDDTKLGGIWMTTPGTDETHQVAEYKDKEGKWSKVTTDWPENWKNFEILEDSGIKQSGHTVKWRFHVNMTPYGINKNQDVSVQAIDAQNNEMSGTGPYTISSVTRAPTYKMDFVPYIKSIYSTAVGSATRSRLGKFPVRAGDDMTIEGMNFAKGAKYIVRIKNSDGEVTKTYLGTKTDLTDSDSTKEIYVESAGVIKVKAPEYSGFVEVIIDLNENDTYDKDTDVITKNNTNADLGCDIEAGYIAADDKEQEKGNEDNGLRKANTAGTNFWTDDRYISVWNVGTTFTDSQNPVSGTLLKYQSTGQKFQSGNNEWSLNENELLAIWAADNSLWNTPLSGTKAYQSNIQNANQGMKVPPRSIDICLAKGDVPAGKNYPFYTMLDNAYLNNTMGNGLMIFRDKAYFDTSWNSAQAGYTVDTLTADTMYTDRYINPKIAASYTQTDTDKIDGQSSEGAFYVYVSYYDVFSHALKYAVVEYTGKFGNNNGTKFKSLATDYTGQDVTIAGEDLTTKTTTFTEEAGEWSDVEIDIAGGTVGSGEDAPTSGVDNPIPVITYYNKTNKQLELVRGKNSAPDGKDEWVKFNLSRPDKSKNFGRYVSTDMDNDGNLYIVAQDVTKGGSLYYGFVSYSEYTNTTGGEITVSWQCVDSGSNAVWTDIKLTDYSKTGSAAEPVVSYMNNSEPDSNLCVKVAYLENDKWDAMITPTMYGYREEKLSVVSNVKDKGSITNKLAVGINSSMLAVDFLRGEEKLAE